MDLLIARLLPLFVHPYTQSCLCNSSYSFQGTLMKLSSYCSHDLKMRNFIEVILDWFLPELWPLNNFSAVSLVSATPPTVSKEFWWNFPVIVPKTWRCAYYTEEPVDCFLPELWPFVSFSHFINRSSCLQNSSYSFQGIFMKLPRYCCHDLKMPIFYRDHARLIFARVMAL